MLKLCTSYSKKIPIPDQEYSSQSFHSSIEIELSDALSPQEIQSRIHNTFELVKGAVEVELNGKVKTVQATNIPENAPPAVPVNGEKASNKQIKFLTDIASHQGIPVSELNAHVKDLYHVNGIYDLTKRDASRLLDSLKNENRKKAA